MIIINGLSTSPSDELIEKYDVTKATRNAKADMLKEYITTKVKINLSWTYVTKQQAQQLLNAVAANSFDVTYFDPQLGTTTTKNFYAGDRSIGVLRYINSEPVYKDFKVNLIEM